MHKKLILVTLFLILAMIVGTVSATTSTIEYNPAADMNGNQEVASNDYMLYGVNFAGNDEYLSEVCFYIIKNTGATGYLYVYLYETPDGLMPTDGSSPIEISDAYPIESLSTSYTFINFTFSETTYLNSSETYGVVLKSTSLVGHYHIGYEGSVSATDQFSTVNAGANWAYSSTDEAIYYIYSESAYNEGGGGGDWTDTDTSALIDNAMEFLVPLIVILLPAILFIIFFKRTDKWLILIGLAIGVGLGYYFFNIPIWLVFLIAIGLIGMAYSEVRRNG